MLSVVLFFNTHVLWRNCSEWNNWTYSPAWLFQSGFLFDFLCTLSLRMPTLLWLQYSSRHFQNQQSLGHLDLSLSTDRLRADNLVNLEHWVGGIQLLDMERLVLSRTWLHSECLHLFSKLCLWSVASSYPRVHSVPSCGPWASVSSWRLSFYLTDAKQPEGRWGICCAAHSPFENPRVSEQREVCPNITCVLMWSFLVASV